MKAVVVTPTLGESPWLGETVASVAACAPGWRHVLVAPAERVAELSARFPAALVVAERGVGMYAAINSGLAAAGDWEAFSYLNDDDLLLPAFASSARAAETAGGRELLAYGRVQLINGRGRRVGVMPVSPVATMNRSLLSQRIEPVYQQGTTVTRAVFERIGGFDESFRLCGDAEFVARACVRGVPMRCVGRMVGAFRLRHGQMSKNLSGLRVERGRVNDMFNLVTTRRTLRHQFEKLVFRVANLPAYVERIARHGWVSFEEMIARGGDE
jgi:hypothetical protein